MSSEVIGAAVPALINQFRKKLCGTLNEIITRFCGDIIAFEIQTHYNNVCNFTKTKYNGIGNTKHYS